LEECDDGNMINHDGYILLFFKYSQFRCSSQCKIDYPLIYVSYAID